MALLIILVAVLFTGDDERRAASGIRLASPAFVPLDPDSAHEVASELGAAFRVYMGAERRRGRE